jgi:NAD(P)-dependent dehydrogenase (short-subunit alcohol dehydrogenase family)
MSSLIGRNCLITGASRGLGAEIARKFWLEGASLFLVARTKAALEQLVSSFPGRKRQDVVILNCDLIDAAVPERIADEFCRRFGRLHVLVNSAAIQGPIGPILSNNRAEWDDTLRVNLMAPVALCRYCIPLMDHSVRAKIMNVSGGGATAARPNFSAYATAKAGLVRFSECIAAETREVGIDVNCVAPGAMATAMTDAILHAGPNIAGAKEYQEAVRIRQQSASKINIAVNLCLFLASAASDGITGKLLSAVWDPWERLQEHRAELDKTDIYTLRRIVPGDRGYQWGER